MSHPGLGRRHAPDARDEQYPLRRSTTTVEPVSPWKYWSNLDVHLDQRSTSSCVGHAWSHFLECSPITHPEPGPFIDPFWIYKEAQARDPWPGPGWPDEDEGTSVRAGWKALRERGVVGEALWSWSLEEIARHIWTTSPVVVGVNWYSSYDRPNNSGRVSITTGAYVRGGHAFVLDGINMQREEVRALNSWGEGYGVSRGRFWFPFKDLRRLLAEDGEAAVALEIQA